MDEKNLSYIKLLAFIASLLVLFVLLFVASIANPKLEFADSGLEAAISDKLKKPNKSIYKTDVFAITELNASHRNITNLNGVEYFHKLTKLNLDHNRIEDISPLAKLSMLKELSLRNNHIHSLEDIAFDALLNLPLNKLNLRDNRLENIELLAGFNDLEYLNLHSNDNIKSIDPVGKLSNLRTLILANVPVGAQAEVLKNLENLERVNIRNAGVTDAEILAWLTEHTEADIRLNIETPVFSHQGGFFTEPFFLTLSHPDPDVTIIYTLDGSEPDINNLDGTTYIYKNSYPENPGDPFGTFQEQSYSSHLYNSPIYIYDRSGEPDKLTQMSSTSHFNPTYFPSTPVRKGTVVRAMVYKHGAITSSVITQSYFVFTDGNPYKIPVISINTNERYLFDYNDGIYNAGVTFDNWRSNNPGIKPHPNDGLPPNNNNYWRGKVGSPWEYPCNVEIYIGGYSVINQSAGFRIHGNWSRKNAIKSLRLYARSKYDKQTIFQYDLFAEKVPFSSNSNNNLFKRIILKEAASWGGLVYGDVVFTRLMQPVYEGVIRVQQAIHFVNGEYFGIQGMRDRHDKYHFGYHYNIDPENIAIVYRRDYRDSGLTEDMSTFSGMKRFIIRKDMSNNENYYQAKELLDIRSFVDHLVIQIYSGNSHYEAGYWRARVPTDDHFGDGKWRVFIQDFDIALRTNNYLSTRANERDIFGSLLANNSFKNYFINRYADHINTTFEPARFQNVVDDARDEVLPYLVEDNHRSNRNIFTIERRNELVTWAHQHPHRARNHIREYFNIPSNQNITLDVSDTERGYIRINTIYILESTPGVSDNPYPWTGVYFHGIPIEVEAVPKPGYEFAGWKELETNERIVKLIPQDDISLTAIFKASELAGR